MHADNKLELVVTVEVDSQSVHQEGQRQSVEHGSVRHQERERRHARHRRHDFGDGEGVSDYTKTVKNNLVKDRAAGLTHILFAVMPKDVQLVTQHLISIESDLDGIMVVNGLRLLDALRKEPHADSTLAPPTPNVPA